jgi:hypothetical protein
MENTTCAVNDRAERSWGHIWVLDALFGVLLNHADDIATTTMTDGFSMDFRKNGLSLCALDHFEDRPRTLFVNVAVCRELWYALFGIANQYDLEFVEFHETEVANPKED